MFQQVINQHISVYRSFSDLKTKSLLGHTAVLIVNYLPISRRSICLHFRAVLLNYPEDGGDTSVTANWHGVISQETGIFSHYNVQTILDSTCRSEETLLSTLHKEKVLEPTLKSSSKNSLRWQWKLRNSVTTSLHHKRLFLFNTVLVTLQAAYPLHAMHNAMNSGYTYLSACLHLPVQRVHM